MSIASRVMKGGAMKEGRYTLKELSREFEMSLRELRKHIKQGTLVADKVGRCYWVNAAELERFIAKTTRTITRNYLCQHYDSCLDDAARANNIFGCDECTRFRQAEKQVISALDLGGMLNLWENVFGRKLTI